MSARKQPWPSGGSGRRAGLPVWADSGRRAEVRFVGRGRDGSRAEILAAITGSDEWSPEGPAAARQVHGADVLEASAADGLECGEGDALVTSEEGFALSVITADCVPVLLEAGGQVAAVHAGWRGLVAGVIAATAGRLAAAGAPRPGEWIGWIGPSIGACCYEVDEDVAARVAAASSPAVVTRPTASSAGGGSPVKPHLDLIAAARHQLAVLGVTDVRTVAACTRCQPDLLWSYRRLGRAAGRNHAFIWLRPA